ncbi:MAG: hemerythrin domain-containing protein [Myxococcaceae bacterium]|nr:hemerythrin domain-containing protein [Myxococcaceae bacterium]
MKPTTLLKQQHRKVIAALKKLEKSKASGTRTALLDEISNDLAAHMAIEQEIFYPAIVDLDEDLILEGFEEHSLGELALKRLRATEPGSEAFRPRAVALRELLEHHIEEEEEELFPNVEKQLDDDELEALGARMRVRFEEAVEQGFEQLVPDAMTQTSADVAKSNLEGPEGLERYLGDAAVH